MDNQGVVWIVPKLPLPAHDGARVATVTLLKELVNFGIPIHLVVINSEGQPEDSKLLREELGVKSVNFVQPRRLLFSSIPTRLQSLIFCFFRPLLGLTLQRYATTSAVQAVSNSIKLGHCKVVVFDGLHTAAGFSTWAGQFSKKSLDVHFFYRAHNREFQIWEWKAREVKNFFYRWFMSFQAGLVKKFEDSLCTASDRVCTVSKEDLLQFKSSVDTTEYAVVPIGYDFSRRITPISRSDRVFFIGRLDWPPNKEGLIWFLENVWTQAWALNPRLHLDIVGSANGNWLAKYSGMSGVKVHGRVDSIEEFYDRSSICIIPVFFGSGTRVKAIEAARFGRPCLSTAVGVEGLPLSPGKDYFQAETENEWVEILASLKTEELNLMGDRAYQAMKNKFDSRNCAELMRQQFHQVGLDMPLAIKHTGNGDGL